MHVRWQKKLELRNESTNIRDDYNSLYLIARQDCTVVARSAVVRVPVLHFLRSGGPFSARAMIEPSHTRDVPSVGYFESVYRLKTGQIFLPLNQSNPIWPVKENQVKIE